MMNIKMGERTRRCVEKIQSYWTISDDEIDIEDIFATEPGKTFGVQVSQTLEFAQRGAMIAQVSGMENLKPKFWDGVVDGSFRELVKNLDDKTGDDLEIVEAIETFAKHYYESVREDQVEQVLLNPDDWIWFLSLVTFAVYAYLDVYSRSLIDIVLNDIVLKKELEEHIKLDNYNELKGASVKQRFATLIAGLKLSPMIEEVLKLSDFERYESAFDVFLRIRHRIAHSNPKLDAEKYQYDDFETDLQDVELLLEDAMEEVTSEFILGIVEEARELFPKLQSVLIRFQLVVKMATMYPAIVDCMLSSRIS
jgi:hypothetical protein